jgi:SpoVK/Ycf46/Vps4 family AAA+-type ATPase
MRTGLSRKLREHLRSLLLSYPERTSRPAATDEALLAELRRRFPSEYSTGVKERALLREISGVREDVERGMKAAVPGVEGQQQSAVMLQDGDAATSATEGKGETEADLRSSMAVPQSDNMSEDGARFGFHREERHGSLNEGLGNSYSQQNMSPRRSVTGGADISGASRSKGKRRRLITMGAGEDSRRAPLKSSEEEVLPSSSAGSGMEFLVPRPPMRYCDVGGMEDVVPVVRQLVELPLLHPELYTHLGVKPPCGLLLHGPPGSGKSLLVNAVSCWGSCSYLNSIKIVPCLSVRQVGE